MAIFTGRRVSIGIGADSSHGAAADPATIYWIPQTALSFDDKVNVALVAGSYGFVANAPMTAHVTGKWAEGEIEGEINANSFGLLLYALLGDEEYTGDDPEAGMNQHAYSILDNNQHPTLTMWVDDPIGDIRFKCVMINSLTLTIAPGELATFSANFVSRAHRDASATPSFITDARFASPRFTLKLAASVDDLSSASGVSIRNFTMTVEKNVERLNVLGSIEPEDIVNKGIRIFGTIDLNYEARTWRDYMLNGTARAMSVLLQTTKLLGATNYGKIEFVFPKVHFDTWEPARGLDDIVTQTINYEVLLDISQSTPRLWTTAEVHNTAASYE